MQRLIVIMALPIAAGLCACNSLRPKTASAAFLTESIPASSSMEQSKIDFPTQIKPIFEARCQPCHFNGGKVYAHLPFDRPETIKRLGTRLFTRIKDDKEQQLIRQFLGQND